MKPSNADRPEIGQFLWLDEEIAEISLLLPGWQAAQLVVLASRQRVTAGQLLRDLVKNYLAQRTKDGRTEESLSSHPQRNKSGGGSVGRPNRSFP